MVLEQFIIDADIIWDQVGKTFFENPEAKPGRIMRVQVVNAGIVEDLTGYTLNLGWTSVRDPSKFGLDAFDDVDITKGIFEIEYTSGMLTNVGPLNATLQLVPLGQGRPIESNNFKLTVKNSAINPEAIQGETSFSTLENALVEVNGWNARIDAVEADFIERANNLDATYPIELNSLKTQLEHKVGDGVKAEPEDLSATTLGLVTGTGGPINLLSVPQDASVTMAKLATDSLEKLPVKIPSKNLFDKTKVTTGFIWDVNSGAKWASASYSVGDYIAMTANTLITTYKCVRVIEWTSAKTYIKGTSLPSGTTLVITTSPTTAYITIDTQNVNLDTTQVELGGTYTGYAPFRMGLNPTDIFDSSIANTKLAVATQTFLDKAVVTQLDIILPTTVYATVGKEFNIYYRNCMLTDTDPDDYDIMISVSKGKLMDDRYSFTPVIGDIGSFVAQFYLRDKKGNNLIRRDVTIEVVAEVTPSTAKKVIFIGDSLTEGVNGSYVTTLKTMMGSKIELLGTRGTAPNLHEGRGGWSTVMYLSDTTSTNKFWNPSTLAFDFTYYMTQQGYASVDDVVLFLGTNDLSTNIETLITNLKTIRTSILAFNANIKVHFVLTPPPSSSFYAFGRSRLFQWDVENKFKGFNKRYITEFEPSVIPVNLNLDAWYDFPRITLARSQRNTETFEIVEERYHCNQVGYDKFADVIYSYLMKKWA